MSSKYVWYLPILHNGTNSFHMIILISEDSTLQQTANVSVVLKSSHSNYTVNNIKLMHEEETGMTCDPNVQTVFSLHTRTQYQHCRQSSRVFSLSAVTSLTPSHEEESNLYSSRALLRGTAISTGRICFCIIIYSLWISVFIGILIVIK